MRRAPDLGCAKGTETLGLLQHGWNVLAVDREKDAITSLERKVRPERRTRLRTRIAAFGEIELPPLDLLLACFSLPFCNPEYFPAFENHW